MVHERLDILLHLDGVVLGLRHAEYPQVAALPSAVLLHEEWQQHEQAAVVHDPPDVDVALDAISGLRVAHDPLRDDERHLCRGRETDRVDEHAPWLVRAALAPVVRPAQHNRVRLQAAQSRCLDAEKEFTLLNNLQFSILINCVMHV